MKKVTSLKNQKGISMVSLVITIIIILILSAIVFVSSGKTMEEADYSKYVSHVSDVNTAFEETTKLVTGKMVVKNQYNQPEQIYNYVAKNGSSEADVLKLKEVPRYTIIQAEGQLGIELPQMIVESGTGKRVPVKYATTKNGQIFTWPPYDHDDKFYITDTDTVEDKMQTKIKVGDEEFEIKLNYTDGTLLDWEGPINEDDDPIKPPEDDDIENPTEHEHSFTSRVQTPQYFCSDATCLVPAKYYYKCTSCEVKGTETFTVGAALGHIYGEKTVVKEANCSEPGSAQSKCSRCGDILNLEVPKDSSNHNGRELQQVTQEPTCATEGVKTYRCSACSAALRTESIAKTDHNSEKIVITKEATCTSAGTKTYRCSGCNKEMKTEAITALGHSEENFKITKTPTCKDTGTKVYTCSRCNQETKTEEVPVDTSKHYGSTETQTITPATCTGTGTTAKTCSLCKATTGSGTLAALGHSWNAEEPPRKCNRCGLEENPDSITYNVVYKSSTGLSLGTETITRDWGTTNTISAPLKNGYLTPSSQTVSWDSVEAKTITFVYQIITYDILIDCDAGTGVSSRTYTIETATFTLDTPTWSGGIFKGWVGSNGTTPQKTVTIPKGSYGAKEYTASWDTFIAQAIYSATDNSLTFIKDIQQNVGSTYGSKAVTAIYTGFETESYHAETDVPWYSIREKITKVVFEDVISPISTAYWFDKFTNCVNMNLSSLDTSRVTDMKYMFYNAGYSATVLEISGLSSWDTSKVTNVEYMFYCTGFSASTWTIGDLSSWNTSKVTNMAYMFYSAGWNARTWNIGNLTNWNTASVTNMAYMLDGVGYSATNLNIGNLNTWNTSNVTNMEGMFTLAGYNSTTFNIGNLNNWDTSNVTNMKFMFCATGYSTSTFNIGDLSSWNTSKVTTMEGMFASAGYKSRAFNIGNLNNWDISSATDISHMFRGAGCESLTWNIGQLDNWNTSKVTDMADMFAYAGMNLTELIIGNISTKTVTVNGKTYTAWNVSSVKNMDNMFNSSSVKELNLAGWNNSNVTSMKDMFTSCIYLEKVTLSANFAFKGTDGYLPVPNSAHITGADGKWYDISNGTGYAPVSIPSNKATTYLAYPCQHPNDKIEGCYCGVCGEIVATLDGDKLGQLITNNRNVTKIQFTSNALKGVANTIDVSQVGDGYDYDWDYCNVAKEGNGEILAYVSNNSVIVGTRTGGKVLAPISAYCLFDGDTDNYIEWGGHIGKEGYSRITSFDFGTNAFDTEHCIDMWGMFRGCSSLTSLDLRAFKTSNVLTMEAMFQECTNLKSVNVSSFTTSKVMDMGSMFSASAIESIDLSHFDMSKVQKIAWMFNGTPIKSLDLSSWNTSSVIDASGIFCGCQSLITLNLNGWNTSNITDMSSMFLSCGSLTTIGTNAGVIDLTNFVTTKVTNMSKMFANCTSMTMLNLSSFNTSKVISMDEMFLWCPKLQNVTLGANFAFKGTNGYLPTPSSDYITGADGKWYDQTTRKGYTPANVPNNKAATYTAIPAAQNVATAILYSDGTLVFQTNNAKDTSYGSVVKEFVGWESATYTATTNGSSGSYGMVPPTSVSATGTPWDSYSTSIKKVIIKSGVTVSSDMDYWFANCTNLSSVEIGSGITRLGEGCFYNCTSLKSITIPANIVYVDKFVFIKSGLTSMTIGGTNAWSTIWPAATTSTSAQMTVEKMISSASIGSFDAMDGTGACEWDRSGESSGSNPCVTPDTLVTLADGTQKRIDQVTYEDQLLVWNFYDGEYAVVTAALVQNHGYDYNNVIKLMFSDGTVTKAVNEHGYFDVTINEFVMFRPNNASEYIGHEFIKADGNSYTTTTLVSVEVSKEYVEAYSILAAYYYNFITDNMFSLTSPVIETNFFMPFEVGEDMIFDAEKMAADIEKYGLYEFADFDGQIPYEVFEGLNIKYLKVAVGKGLITYNQIVELLHSEGVIN